MVLRGDLDAPRAEIHHRMIGAMMAEIELVSLAAQRQPDQLMTKADAEHRLLAQHARDGSVSIWQRRRITGSVRQENSVGVVRQYLLSARRRRDHLNPKAGRHQPAQNVELDSVVERDNRRRV